MFPNVADNCHLSFRFLFTRAAEEHDRRNNYEYFRVYLTNDGFVSWTPGGSYQTKCDVDVTLYPFDVQRCKMIFINWMYLDEHVNLTLAAKHTKALSREAKQNEEWAVEELTPRRDEDVSYAATITYEFIFRRKPLYYTVNIIIPSLVLSLLVLLVLRLPPDSGDKISMGVTLLLAFAVYMLLVSDSVPVTSDGIPIIGIPWPQLR